MRSERVRAALDTVNPTPEQKTRMRQALAREMGASQARAERSTGGEAPAEQTGRKTSRRAAISGKNAPTRRQQSKVAIWLSAAATVALILGAGFLIQAFPDGLQSKESAGTVASGGETADTAAATVTLDDLASRAEYQAQREWLDYRSTAGAGADSSDVSEIYQSYGCKDSADTAELDEIAARYGLTLGLQESGSMTTQEQFEALVVADEKGNLSALVPEDSPSGVYRTQDASGCDLSGDSYITGSVRSSTVWDYPVSFELYYNAENSFSPFFPLMGGAEDYESWSYTTANNVSLAIGLGADSAVIYCPAEEGFYLVYTEAIRVGDTQSGEHTMTREQLEAFAETFAFPQTVTEDRIAAGEESYAAALSRWQAAAQGENTDCAEACSTAMSLGQSEYGYTFRELDGDGIDELLVTNGVKVFALYTGGDNIPLLVDSNAFSYYLTGSGNITRECWMDETRGISSYQFYSLEGGTLELEEGTAFNGEDYMSWNAYGTRTEIAPEQYDDIVAAYHYAELAYKPLSDYAGQGDETQADSGDTTAAGEEIYAEILQEWVSQTDTREQQICVTGEKRPFSGEKAGYLFRDLDGDGTAELLITNGISIYAIYAPDGSLIMDEAYNTDTLWLCEDGTLCLLQMANGEGTTIKQASHYVVQRGKCQILEQVRASEGGWGRQDENGSGMVISEVEFNETIAEIQALLKADLSFTPLAQWPGYLGLLGSDAQRTAYRAVLEKYRTAIAEGWSQARCAQEGISLLTANASGLDEIGYQCRDLDDDGRMELIVTNGSIIYGLYAMSDGGAKEVLLSYERLAYYLCAGNTIASEGSNSAAISVYEYAHLEGSSLVVELSLTENYEENAASPWFRGSTGTDETLEPISQEEFASERAQYLRLSSLHFTPLSELE